MNKNTLISNILLKSYYIFNSVFLFILAIILTFVSNESMAQFSFFTQLGIDYSEDRIWIIPISYIITLLHFLYFYTDIRTVKEMLKIIEI